VEIEVPNSAQELVWEGGLASHVVVLGQLGGVTRG